MSTPSGHSIMLSFSIINSLHWVIDLWLWLSDYDWLLLCSIMWLSQCVNRWPHYSWLLLCSRLSYKLMLMSSQSTIILNCIWVILIILILNVFIVIILFIIVIIIWVTINQSLILLFTNRLHIDLAKCRLTSVLMCSMCGHYPMFDFSIINSFAIITNYWLRCYLCVNRLSKYRCLLLCIRLLH